ncbi:hypothetical protein GCM10025886_14010 [Tetragenococcus halophilus subsp. flandriensis]|uniref:DUF961 family protein n=1 Tax=Tetragenococcus halophilus TaxID=51669 RepID=UPI0023E9CF0D|nr:DUF961 family protein [Tetragenococcus halophilus]GMA08250.1 hypothetical protein GCM10025886_14010 [Tetragenococcus halophilus subsp. flandriensis]
MAVDFVKIKNETFGKVSFISYRKEDNLTEGFGRNQKVTHYCYQVTSEKRGAFNVYVPTDNSLVTPPFMGEIRLTNPIVSVTGDMIQDNNGRNRGYTDWVVYADQIEKVGK